MAIRVLIADDHEIIRTGLRAVFDRAAEISVVGEASDAQATVELAGTHKPDVITLDLGLAEAGGSDLITKLLEVALRTKILVFTATDTIEAMQKVFSSGGCGYVAKVAGIAEVVTGVRAVAAGRAFVSLTWGDSLFCRVDSPIAESPQVVLQRLSPREQEVLQRIARGMTNQQVADELFLSVKTIETYRSRLGQKIGSRDRAIMYQFAEESGLLAQTLVEA